MMAASITLSRASLEPHRHPFLVIQHETSKFCFSKYDQVVLAYAVHWYTVHTDTWVYKKSKHEFCVLASKNDVKIGPH